MSQQMDDKTDRIVTDEVRCECTRRDLYCCYAHAEQYGTETDRPCQRNIDHVPQCECTPEKA
jgi:hypothetical protein